MICALHNFRNSCNFAHTYCKITKILLLRLVQNLVFLICVINSFSFVLNNFLFAEAGIVLNLFLNFEQKLASCSEKFVLMKQKECSLFHGSYTSPPLTINTIYD